MLAVMCSIIGHGIIRDYIDHFLNLIATVTADLRFSLGIKLLDRSRRESSGRRQRFRFHSSIISIEHLREIVIDTLGYEAEARQK